MQTVSAQLPLNTIEPDVITSTNTDVSAAPLSEQSIVRNPATDSTPPKKRLPVLLILVACVLMLLGVLLFAIKTLNFQLNNQSTSQPPATTVSTPVSTILPTSTPTPLLAPISTPLPTVRLTGKVTPTPLRKPVTTPTSQPTTQPTPQPTQQPTPTSQPTPIPDMQGPQITGVNGPFDWGANGICFTVNGDQITDNFPARPLQLAWKLNSESWSSFRENDATKCYTDRSVLNPGTTHIITVQGKDPAGNVGNEFSKSFTTDVMNQ